MKTTTPIIVIDLEATCWEGLPPKGQVNEIIEIGICVLDTTTCQVTGNKGILVRPERSAQLAVWLATKAYRQEYCGLTAIPHTKGMYALFYDAEGQLGYRGITSGPDANDVCLSSVPRQADPVAYLFFNRESYSAYCREYREYWEWIALRNEVRYQGNKEHGKDYDA